MMAKDKCLDCDIAEQATCVCEMCAELSQLRTENERLKKFIIGWAGHEARCDCLDEGSPRTDCTCGYDDARDQSLKDCDAD